MTRRPGTSGAPRACVIGSIDLVTPLGLAGIRCALVAHPGNIARFSRYTDEIVAWADPWDPSGALLDRILGYARAQAEPPVLFYEGDAELLAISRGRDRLDPWLRFLLPAPALVEDLVDKARFGALAERLGLPVPRTRVLAAGADWDAVDLRFPLVLKPLVRRTATWEPVGHGAKALRVQSRDELRVLGRRRPDGLALLAQESVEGPETRIESYHVYVDRDGATVAEFTGRKIRTRPARYGRSTAVEITAAPDVLRLGRAVTERLGLRGVAKLDFKRDDAARLRLLEVNPRFNLWHHPAARAGVNLPELVYRDLVGLPRAGTPAARAGVRWVYRDEDARAAREAGIPLRRWLRWALACEARSGASLDDPMPLVRGALALAAARLPRRAGAR